MSWAWSRTFYAQKDGRIFNFEAKRNRDDAVRNHGFEAMKSSDAWKHYPNITRITMRSKRRKNDDKAMAFACVVYRR